MNEIFLDELLLELIWRKIVKYPSTLLLKCGLAFEIQFEFYYSKGYQIFINDICVNIILQCRNILQVKQFQTTQTKNIWLT